MMVAKPTPTLDELLSDDFKMPYGYPYTVTIGTRIFFYEHDEFERMMQDVRKAIENGLFVLVSG